MNNISAFRYLAAALAVAASSVVTAHASIFTFNDTNAYCVPAGSASPCADTSDGTVAVASQLAVGAVFGFTSPSFVDATGASFAARGTVLATGALPNRPVDEPAPSFTSNTVSGTNSWIHILFDFVESFDTDTRTFGNDRSVTGLQKLVVDDIDSNFGDGAYADFSDVAGVNAPILSLGTLLEEGGFIDRGNNFAALPTTGFEYARLKQTGDADGNGTDDWLDAANVPADGSPADKAAVRAIYDATALTDGFELVWGSTSDVDHYGVKRGWNLSLVVEPAVIPLPASVTLLLAALASVALLARRRQLRPATVRTAA